MILLISHLVFDLAAWALIYYYPFALDQLRWLFISFKWITGNILMKRNCLYLYIPLFSLPASLLATHVFFVSEVNSLSAALPWMWIRLKLSVTALLSRHMTLGLLGSLPVVDWTIQLSDHIKLLRVAVDNVLAFSPHVYNVCGNSYYHIRSLHRIRP